jgi:NAD(P)-dependent dehydrogenase (short-subunit alcohol dehydrogenase family)
MTQPPNLTGKVAVVTGAGRGVGRAISLALATSGAKVALVARSRVQLEETCAAIIASGGIGRVFALDVTRSSDVLEELKNGVERLWDAPQILVNCAGTFGPIDLLKDGDPARWIETISVNTIGPYLTCRAFVGGMIAARWGRIVNATSAASLHPPGPLNSAYAASKVALNQMTRSLAAELEGTGVTANVFHPGDIKTAMWRDIKARAEAMGPAGQGYRDWADWVERTGGDPPEKAANLVLGLTSDSSAEINGQFLWIDGGLQTPDSRGWVD